LVAGGGELDRPGIILADRRYLVARIRALGIGTQMENDVAFEEGHLQIFPRLDYCPRLGFE
jgi:hypothetical protein